MSRLCITLLGRFSVSYCSKPLDLRASTARLVAYLALASGRPLLRTRVAGVLWPDLSERRARANLSTVTWRLRRVLGERGMSHSLVEGTGELISLSTALCEIDVEHFRRDSLGPECKASSLDILSRGAHALTLYRGDLLEDWDCDWCVTERENLRQRYLHTLRTLVEGFERRGRLDLSLRYAKQAVETDPFSEQNQRNLIRLHCLSGDKVSAAHQYRRFAELTRVELGVDPGEETELLIRDVRKRHSSTTGVGPPAIRRPIIARLDMIPVVGRALERDLISTVMESARSGKGGGILLVGDAGIGKSHLADWASEEWAARGGAASLGRCVEFNEPIPYQPVLDALGSLVGGRDLEALLAQREDTFSEPAMEYPGATATVMADGGSQNPPSGKLRFFGRLKTLLQDISQHRPVLLVIEDLQWADSGSTDFLAYLLEHARRMRLALVLTSRLASGHAAHEAAVLRLSRYCLSVVRLAALTEGETGELVRVLLETKQAPPELVSWAYRETEGNPFFILETLRLLELRGYTGVAELMPSLGQAGVAETTPHLSMPDGVRSAITQRLAFIDSLSLRVAEMASVLGRSFDADLLSVVTMMGDNRLSRTIGSLVRAGVFEREGAGYRFTHDKIRSVCYDKSTERLRRLCHARAAAALAQMSDASPYRLAWHQHSAGQWHAAVTSWDQAGDRARAVYAHEESCRAYAHAITCLRRDATKSPDVKNLEEFGLLCKSEDVLAVMGKPSERVRVLTRMESLSRRISRHDCETVLLLRKARFKEHVGDFTGAASLARKAWVVARSVGDKMLETEALLALAGSLNRGGRLEQSLSVSRVVLGRLDRLPSVARARACWESAMVHIKLGNCRAAAPMIRLAKESLADSALSEGSPLVLAAEAAIEKWTGDPRRSRDLLTTARRIADETHDSVAQARILVQVSILDALEGKLGDSLRMLRKALVTSRSVGHTRTCLSCLNEVANGIARLLGNYGWAESAIARALGMPELSNSRSLTAVYLDTRAQLLLDQGRTEEARSTVEGVLRAFSMEFPSSEPYGPYLEALARRGVIHLKSGGYTEAVADLERVRGIQVRTGERLLLPDTLSHLALAYAALGDAEQATAASCEAVDLLYQMGFANLQPQRILWHHYLVLDGFGVAPRLQYLRKAVELIEAQGATLSRAQCQRLTQRVALNRDILAAWEQAQKQQEEVLRPSAALSLRERPGRDLSPTIASTSPGTEESGDGRVGESAVRGGPSCSPRHDPGYPGHSVGPGRALLPPVRQ